VDPDYNQNRKYANIAWDEHSVYLHH